MNLKRPSRTKTKVWGYRQPADGHQPLFNTLWALNKQYEAWRTKLSVFHLHYSSRSLWLYQVSAAQDVVQQLILRLIHFLLNCPQTEAVIQPVLVNPRCCLAHRA